MLIQPNILQTFSKGSLNVPTLQTWGEHHMVKHKEQYRCVAQNSSVSLKALCTAPYLPSTIIHYSYNKCDCTLYLDSTPGVRHKCMFTHIHFERAINLYKKISIYIIFISLVLFFRILLVYTDSEFCWHFVDFLWCNTTHILHRRKLKEPNDLTGLFAEVKVKVVFKNQNIYL